MRCVRREMRCLTEWKCRDRRSHAATRYRVARCVVAFVDRPWPADRVRFRKPVESAGEIDLARDGRRASSFRRLVAGTARTSGAAFPTRDQLLDRGDVRHRPARPARRLLGARSSARSERLSASRVAMAGEGRRQEKKSCGRLQIKRPAPRSAASAPRIARVARRNAQSVTP